MSVNAEFHANLQATQPVSGQRRLVVLVPGLHGSSKLWRPLLDRLEKEPGFGPDEAVWLPFDHGLGVYSLGRLANYSRRLNALISARWDEARGFGDVVLIGHSTGGLIARQAYLLAAGAVPGSDGSQWASHVSRIVLLASINRGVDLKAAPIYSKVMAYFARVTPFMPRFAVLDALRGSGFLTNLRIDWIRHFGNFPPPADTAALSAPLVVQLLGTSDGMVSQQDSKDVLAFPDGHYLEVPEADHKSIYRLDQTDDPDLRYAVLRRGLTGSFAPRPEPPPDPVRRVVFLLHGIRASNVDGWVETLARRIKAIEGASVSVKNPTYGYFTAAQFVLPSVRKRNIRIFQDWYTEELAKHPAAEFDVIAHSNGTYILGHSLLGTPGMRFTNVALAGSVLPEDFWLRFANLGGQVQRIRNARANRDFPVAGLCNALRGLRMRDIGTAGFSGFRGDATYEVAYHGGGHSAALETGRLDLLVAFALSGKPDEPPGLQQAGYYRPLSNFMLYLAPLLVLGMLYCMALAIFGCGWGQLSVGWPPECGPFQARRLAYCIAGLLAVFVVADIL